MSAVSSRPSDVDHQAGAPDQERKSRTRRRILIGVALAYLAVLVLIAWAFGLSGHTNHQFQVTDEFKLPAYINLGVMSINRAVVYLAVAAFLTVLTMVWVARRMQMRPNRVQTAVESVYALMRDNMTRGSMPDALAAKWFPFIGALFLFLWWSNIIGYIPLPSNSLETFVVFGVHIPTFALYAATANISVPFILALVVFIFFNYEGIRAQGVIGYAKSLIPAGVKGPMLLLVAPLEVISIFMRLLSLTIRLFANILAGHMIILFMAGGLAVILGLSFLGWFTMPIAVAIYLFELGLIATLQAFIFALLAAIYIGGAVSHH